MFGRRRVFSLNLFAGGRADLRRPLSAARSSEGRSWGDFFAWLTAEGFDLFGLPRACAPFFRAIVEQRFSTNVCEQGRAVQARTFCKARRSD